MESLPSAVPPTGSGPVAAEPPPASPPASLTELADAYCQRHRKVENYLLIYFLIFALLRRARLAPLDKGPGPTRISVQLAALLLVAAGIVGAPVALTAMLDEWELAPVGTWAAVGLSFGLVVVLMYRPLLAALDNFLCLHRAVADEAGLRRLIAWERRFFHRRIAIPAAFGFSGGLLAYLYYLERYSGEKPMAWGTALVGFLLLYGVGEIIYSVVLLALESSVLRDCNYRVYKLSPLDSVALRRAIRGSSQLGLLVSLMATLFIVGFVALLEDRPVMVTQVGLFLVALSYLATLAGVLLPRLAIKSIVQRHKEAELAPLQERLDALTARLEAMSEEEFEKYKRIKEAHDTIRDATEEVLPLRVLGRLVGALVLPTLTFVASRFGESLLQGMMQRLRH